MSEHPGPAGPHLTDDVRWALEALIRIVERQSGQFTASVLIVSEDGEHLLDAAAPGLPQEYRDAVHGLRIGPAAGSCGTAAFRGRRVIVSDIASDPLWQDFAHLAARAGVSACWSQPVQSATGEVLGTFAMYYREKREPTRQDLEIIEAAARRAALILERARSGVSREALIAGID